MVRPMALRWNFRLGPIQFTSPVGLIGTSFLAGMVLCCCGAGIVAAVSDDPVSPPPVVPVVETVTPTPEPEPTETEPTEAAEQLGDRPVTAGAFCDTAGQTGVTAKGTAMVCRGPGDLRWRRPL